MTLHEVKQVEVGQMYIIERKPSYGQEMEYIAARSQSAGCLTYLHNWHVGDVERIKEYGWKIYGPVQLQPAQGSATGGEDL